MSMAGSKAYRRYSGGKATPNLAAVIDYQKCRPDRCDGVPVLLCLNAPTKSCCRKPSLSFPFRVRLGSAELALNVFRPARVGQAVLCDRMMEEV